MSAGDGTVYAARPTAKMSRQPSTGVPLTSHSTASRLPNTVGARNAKKRTRRRPRGEHAVDDALCHIALNALRETAE